MKRITVLSLLCIMLFAQSVSAYNVQLKPFKDEEQDYSREPIYTLAALGIINGYEGGTYRPNGDLSREAFLKLLVMAVQAKPNSAGGKLPPDVAGDRWSAPYVAIAYEREWLGSLLDELGGFQPARTITRQEVAMLTGKALLESANEQERKQWLSEGWQTERDKRAFKDGGAIEEDMRPYVYYTAYRGIMEGDPTGFKPEEPLIRKQAAAVIYRLLDKRISERQVSFTGYYALGSYPAIQHMDKLSNVIYGWSNLAYSEPGSAKLNTASTEYRIPSGYEEAVKAADKDGVSGRELMVFYNQGNLKDFLKDKAAMAAFNKSLIETLENPAYGFTGVSIDFEGLKEAGSAADFTAFLKALRSELGDKTLSVAVPPIHYFKGYDLKSIGEHADTVILMAYDFTHSESGLPSAPLQLVNDTVQTALESIPADKLVLGISKQANQWITSEGVTSPAFRPAIADVEKRLAEPGVTTEWMMPHFLKKATFQDERGSHVLYYEDTQSIAKKLWLAKFYGLKGVSLWHMGNYTASDWALVGEHSER